MRKLVLSLTAAAALVATASIVPASATMLGTAPSMQAAIDNAGAVQDVRYVCRHRPYSSRRVCWWRPGGPYWRHGVYGPRRGWYGPRRGWYGGPRRHWR
jgi:hypothetical protein